MDLECATSDSQETMQLQQILDEHQGWLRRLVVSRVGDASTADDILQEVGAAAVVAVNLPSEPDQLRPWLCRVALRQCALAVRGLIRQRRLEQRLQENGQDNQAEPVDPIYWLIAEEDRAYVKAAMARLDDESRQVLTWKYVDRLTYQTIAQQLELSRHAAEYRVVRARQALRAVLLTMGFEGEERT
ncbi:MAG: RNA polymerase sigma factor [Aeoliella sp.]